LDEDGDGFNPEQGDCDDTDPHVHPAAAESCLDDIDNDCDGETAAACGTVSLADADAIFRYEDNGYGDARSGHAVAGAGDVDADGFDDLVIGMPGLASGRSFLITGPVSGETYLTEASFEGVDDNDEAGFAVSGAGDIDGDGKADILIGAPQQNSQDGVAYVLLGPADGSGRSLATAEFVIMGDESNGQLGAALSGAGDVDGDGLADILVGAPEALSDGAAYLLLGGGALVKNGGIFSAADADAMFSGEVDVYDAGRSVSSAGDTNGDGLDDLLIGTRAHATYLVLGPTSGDASLEAAAAKLESGSSDSAGHAVSGAGDLDGDGFDDLIIGAPGESTAGATAGGVYVLHGPVSGSVSLSKATLMIGEAAEGEAGSAVAGAGDVDGDGLSDVLVGAHGVATDTGKTYLLRGPLRTSRSLYAADVAFTGEAIGDESGYSVAGAGDVDGDGRADILIGAPGWVPGGSKWSSHGATYLVHSSSL